MKYDQIKLKYQISQVFCQFQCFELSFRLIMIG